jgi:hypothetical protein
MTYSPFVHPDALQRRYALGLTERQNAALCVGLLAAASALSTFPLACAVPFAAFGVVAALMLPISSAMLVTVALWAINQAIGFGLLGYPLDGNALAWAPVMLACALLATATAAVVVQTLRLNIAVTALLALAASYAAYELGLLAASRLLGGEDAMAADIVARIGLTNLLWLMGLVALLEAARLAVASRGGSPAQA